MNKRDRKAHRMEIRKTLGLRVTAPPPQVTKERWSPRRFANACFKCRVSFKRPLSTKPHKCPTCGGEMAEMGRFFKAPRRTELKQWQKVQWLWNAGYRFRGRSKGPPFPARLNEVEAFIRANPRHPNRLKAYWE